MSSLVGCGDAREGQRVWGIAAGLTRKRPLALGKEPNTTKGWLEAHAAVNGRGGRRGERATSPAIGCGSCPSPRSATAPTGDHDQPLGAGPTTFLVSSQLGWSAVAHLRGAQGRSGRAVPRNSESTGHLGGARTPCPPRRRGRGVLRPNLWTRNVLKLPRRRARGDWTSGGTGSLSRRSRRPRRRGLSGPALSWCQRTEGPASRGRGAEVPVAACSFSSRLGGGHTHLASGVGGKGRGRGCFSLRHGLDGAGGGGLGLSELEDKLIVFKSPSFLL